MFGLFLFVSVYLGLVFPEHPYFPTDEDMVLIQANDLEEASFAVPSTWEKVLLDTEEIQSPQHGGTPQQAQLASPEMKKTPEVKTLACLPTSSSTLNPSSVSSHQRSRQKSYPSPLKRASRPRKRRPKAAPKINFPTPLIPNLSRTLKAKFSKPHPRSQKVSIKKVTPLMSIKTGITMERPIVLEILG